MVRPTRNSKFSGLLAALLLAVCAAPADAAVIASVDRSRIELNESFTLKVTVDTAIDVEPDASALEEDFYVGSRSQLSNTTIVNGQITRSRTWTYVLMAKQDGDLVIPPVVIGSERSEPIDIKVLPPSNAVPGEAEIFVSAEVDYDESYVQAQILYTVKVYRSVATRQPRLSDPEITGVDVLVEIAGEERSYDSLIDGTAYNVVERVYAIFPQQSGGIRISPAMFEARVLRNGRISGRKIFQSDPIEITVNPIPPPPDGFPGAAWLPAKSVALSEDWSREPRELPAGEPITRHLKVEALGQLSTQIPAIELDVSDKVKVYPDKPELTVAAQSGGILATRTDQYAMIAMESGNIELPDVRLPWWDIEAGEWKIASLPGRTIAILPSADALVPQPPPPEEPEPAVGAGESVVVHSMFWRRVSEVLAGVWILTVLSWWWSGRPKQRRSDEAEEPPLHKQQAKFLKQARKAALDADAAMLKAALLQWGKLQWPEHAPRNIGDLAGRVTDPLASELERLARRTYGPDAGGPWRGEEIAKALRSFGIRSEQKVRQATDILPPLMPSPPS
ncbi:MAG: BatD family protein [Gammaproteobacteria bacterium]|nr:BatD family protein [Gammaproteobacteria bacterium]MDH4255119.1 BatD family protein [Gammaproteobacteria bacterium]MDH5310812.1 BatD family protein [Gammaproteobacteria bacterium]